MSESQTSPCMTVEPTLTATSSVFQPSPGDLVVLKFGGFLGEAQRQKVKEIYRPVFEELGCKFLVIDGGADLMLIKKAATEGSQP